MIHILVRTMPPTFLLSSIVFALLVNSSRFEQEIETPPCCKKLTICDCLQPTDNSLPVEIHCPNFADDQMQLYYRLNVSLIVQCLPPVNWNLFNENQMLEPLRQNGNISQLKAVNLGLVDDLKVSHCNLSNSFGELQNLLGATKPRYLSLRSIIFNDLSYLTKTDMPLFDSIDILNLENNNIVDIPYDLFKRIKHLKHVSLNFNKIENVTQTFDKNMESLQIAQNRVSYIDKEAFSGLKLLETLHIWGNNITHIEYHHFQSLNNLRALELSRNFIQELNANVFSSLILLKTLNLESNLLKTLPDNLLINNKQIESVRLSRNNRLERLPVSLFANLPTLKNVRLNSCSLSHISQSLFTNSFELEIIDLNENALNELPTGLFKGLKRLKVLNLANNLLRKIPQELLQDLTSLTKLDVSGNCLQQPYNNFKIHSSAITKHNITTQLTY